MGRLAGISFSPDIKIGLWAYLRSLNYFKGIEYWYAEPKRPNHRGPLREHSQPIWGKFSKKFNFTKGTSWYLFKCALSPGVGKISVRKVFHSLFWVYLTNPPLGITIKQNFIRLSPKPGVFHIRNLSSPRVCMIELWKLAWIILRGGSKSFTTTILNFWFLLFLEPFWSEKRQKKRQKICFAKFDTI